MKIVFDASVWIAAVGSRKGFASQSINESYRLNNIEIFISPFILDEIVLNLEKKFDFERTLAEQAAQTIRNLCDFEIDITTQEIGKIKFTDDLKDRHVLALCHKIEADYLISFDRKHLLPLGKFGQTKIIEPRDFVKIINS